MNWIEGPEYKEKGSKFFGIYAQIESVDEFKKILADVKRKFKGANHYCYAYIVDESQAGDQMDLFNRTVYREKYTNDNEPGAVGAAMMDVLKRSGRKNSAVIVVRYFGGILLGVGGMIRAYREATEILMKHLN